MCFGFTDFLERGSGVERRGERVQGLGVPLEAEEQTCAAEDTGEAHPSPNAQHQDEGLVLVQKKFMASGPGGFRAFGLGLTIRGQYRTLNHSNLGILSL